MLRESNTTGRGGDIPVRNKFNPKKGGHGKRTRHETDAHTKRTRTFLLLLSSSIFGSQNRSDYSTLLLKKQCDMIGLQSLFTNGILQYSAEALSDIQACFVDIQTIENLFSENVDCAKEMMQYVNKDMITMFDKVYSFSTKHIHGRLAELLLYLHKNIYGTNPFKLTLSKTDLSEILGTSKESVSRMFKELKQDKILKESHHTIEILDFARLKMISHTG